MRIKEGFELRTICGENIIISHGVQNINFTKIISLNESAAEVWKSLIGTDFTVEDMVKVILDNYEIDEATALNDCNTLLKNWKEVGLVE